MLHGLFYQSLCYVSGHGNISVVLLSMEGLRALRFKQKYLNLCSDDERRSYGFGTTWGWVINDIIFIFGWTNPLREQSVCVLFPPLDGAAVPLKRDAPALSPDQKSCLSPPPSYECACSNWEKQCHFPFELSAPFRPGGVCVCATESKNR